MITPPERTPTSPGGRNRRPGGTKSPIDLPAEEQYHARGEEAPGAPVSRDCETTMKERFGQFVFKRLPIVYKLSAASVIIILLALLVLLYGDGFVRNPTLRLPVVLILAAAATCLSTWYLVTRYVKQPVDEVIDGMDRLAEKGRRVLSRKERRIIYTRAQEIVAQDLPYVSLWYNNNIVAMDKRLQGFVIYPAGDYRSLARAKWE